MNSLFFNSKWSRIIAVYEMAGGIIGLGLVIFLIPAILASLNVWMILISIFAVCGYILSFVAGLFLWKKMEKGIILSIICQAIQIPRFIIGSFSYLFISGLEFIIYFSLNNLLLKLKFNFSTYFGSHFDISYDPDNSKYVLIGLNLVALTLFIYLRRVFRNGKNNQLIINDEQGFGIGNIPNSTTEN